MSIVHAGRFAAPLLALLFGVTAAAAQESVASTPETAPSTQDAVVYGRIAQADTPLRCFPTSYSPVYGEALSEGDVVVLTGESQNGFKAARLPLGPSGFVHARFADVGEDGVVKSKGSRVAFRYRANAREAPVRFVDDGTTFRLVTADGEWLQVRFPDQVVWIPDAAVVAFPAAEAGETVVAAWRGHQERQEAQIAEASARMRDQRAAEAKLAGQREELVGLRKRFGDEVAKPTGEQDVKAIRDDTAALVAALPEASAERGEAERLLVAVEQQARAIEIWQLANAVQPAIQPTVEPRRVVTDPLGEFATGWLRKSGGLFSPPTFTLEKGGQVLLELACSTARYDLDIFDGMEIAVRGPTGRPDAESIRRLDVQHIEVLSRPRK